MLFAWILKKYLTCNSVGYHNGHLKKAVGITVDVRGTEHYKAYSKTVETAVKNKRLLMFHT